MENRQIKNNSQKILDQLPKTSTCIAASKGRTLEEISAAKAAGIGHFGENYVQEAAGKTPYVKGAIWHLIGPLQTNKANQAITLFDVFHTIDRPKLATKLNQAAAKANKRPDVFIQVNMGQEPQKSGVVPENLAELIEHVRDCKHLKLVGFMVIPPAQKDPVPFFKELRALAARHNLKNLSMGMSGDWPQAIEHSATHIRVGTAIFGPRAK